MKLFKKIALSFLALIMSVTSIMAVQSVVSDKKSTGGGCCLRGYP